MQTINGEHVLKVYHQAFKMYDILVSSICIHLTLNNIFSLLELHRDNLKMKLNTFGFFQQAN